MQWHFLMLALVLVLEQFTWMKLDAVGVRVNLLTALEALLLTVTSGIDIIGEDTTSIHVEVLQ